RHGNRRILQRLLTLRRRDVDHVAGFVSLVIAGGVRQLFLLFLLGECRSRKGKRKACCTKQKRTAHHIRATKSRCLHEKGSISPSPGSVAAFLARPDRKPRTPAFTIDLP